MKTKFSLTEAFVIVDNYGEGDSIDDTVYLDGKEADETCKKYNLDKSYQNEGCVINIGDYASAQYERGSSNARYD